MRLRKAGRDRTRSGVKDFQRGNALASNRLENKTYKFD